MLNPAVKLVKSMYSFVIKLIVAAGIFSVSVLPKHRLIYFLFMILCSLILLSSLYTIGMAEIYLPNNWLLIFPCFSFFVVIT